MKAEDLVAEVAKRRGVMLTPADPAIILGTVLELQIEDATKQIDALLQNAIDQQAAATVAQVEAAKGVGQAIITQAGEWVSERVRQTMDQAIGELTTGWPSTRLACGRSRTAACSLPALPASQRS
jgi:hypothetical protein